MEAEGAADDLVRRFDAVHGQVVDISNVDPIMLGDSAPGAKSTMLSKQSFLGRGCSNHLLNFRLSWACYLA